MNDELRQPFEQLVQAYNHLPEAWTRRFERLEESEESLILRHREVNLNIELSPLPSVFIDNNHCHEPECGIYIPVARFQASLYAPLENIASSEEGIEALRTLQQQEQRLNLSLPTFRRDEQFVFGHYEGGVEYTIDIPRVRLERPLRLILEHDLSSLIRGFSLIPYNFNLDVNAEPPYHPGTEEFRRQAEEYLQGYEERNPTARIMGTGGGWLNFWSEDEETLRATSRDLEALAESIQSRLQCRTPFRITTTITPRNQG